MNLFRPALATVLTAAVLAAAGCAAGGTAVQTSSSSPSVSPSGPANAPALEQAYVSVVAKVLPSVVQITSDRSLGSGIVFDTKGDIVTNAHVVGRATKFQVRLADNPKAIPATLVGAYRPDDLAVIELDQPPSTLYPAHFGDSAKLQAGDIVLAMGNPLGLTGSVTDGIISGTGRTVTEPAEGSSQPATLPDVIQTSAASTRATAAVRWSTWLVTSSVCLRWRRSSRSRAVLAAPRRAWGLRFPASCHRHRRAAHRPRRPRGQFASG